jgi:two-component sensor histidine kinase
VTEWPDLVLPPKDAVDFALVLHELATNAAKHGAFSRDVGRVHLDWRVEGVGDATRLIFHWRESGVQSVGNENDRGFGLTLIERLFAASPRRSVKFQFEAGGICCSIMLLLDNAAVREMAGPEHAARGGLLEKAGDF